MRKEDKYPYFYGMKSTKILSFEEQRELYRKEELMNFEYYDELFWSNKWKKSQLKYKEVI